MERSDSISSQSTGPLRPPSASGPFAYQTRLLERTSSKRSTHNSSLSRTNSQSGTNILTNPTGSSTPASTRRWVPSHRVANSLDSVRGKWEERSREAAADDSRALASSPTKASPLHSGDGRLSQYRPSTPPSQSYPLPDAQRTPTYLKRHTMPAPIIASPLSPNSTGVSVEADSPSSPSSTRIHLPTSIHSASANSRATSSFTPPRRTNTTLEATSFDSETTTSTYTSPFTRDTPSSVNSSPSPLKRRPLSSSSPTRINAFQALERTKSLERTNSLERSSLERTRSLHTSLPPTPTTPTTPASVMSPPTYRSSYMAKKNYGENLLSGRKVGGHLPRIASGDGDDHWEEEDELPQPPLEEISNRTRLERRESVKMTVVHDVKGQESDAGVGEGDAVAGVPGRLRLQRNRIPQSPTPIPSSKLIRGSLWADVQRHHIQVYEYLCHVGEAKEWIEGCLNLELDVDVLKLDDGLRNGVVLAKLVKKFTGDAIAKRIYEAPKLSFLHSDNINYFFVFVRAEGLPEGFIFELTDLYEKKNFPKVIYCIHALSHLLVRRRRNEVQPIRNLLGHYKFTDDQLRLTQKGLKDAGVSMPNFGNVGRELAKEINEEPEIEVETEDERRDRELIENEGSIISLQSQCRGFLAHRMRLIHHYVTKVQAHCRAEREQQRDLTPWSVSLQALGRGVLLRKRWQTYLHEIDRSTDYVVKLQAQIRGVLQRRRWARIKAALRSSRSTFVKLQSAARVRLVKQNVSQLSKSFSSQVVQTSVAGLQAHARGALLRRKADAHLDALYSHRDTFTALQSQCRGILTRRRMRKQMAKLEDVSQTVIRIQTACRTYLARKRLLALIRGLRKSTPSVITFQTLARAKLTRQRHEAVTRALTTPSTAKAVGGLQALARACLARNRHREVTRKLDFVAPDMVRFQAAIRGALVRDRYYGWRDHLYNSQPVAVALQALLRGTLQRRKFRAKMQYYRANLNKVVKIQSLFRAKETREQYKQLTMGQNVSIGTIKNFVHLLDDSEADFKDEIKIERLRKRVVEQIRENQTLENDVQDLDTKIALVVENVKSVEKVKDLLHRRHTDAAMHAARSSLLAAHGDPFSGPSTLDHRARRKLELYQQLFYLLQTKGEYLSRLFNILSKVNEKNAETNRRFVERVVLMLFGYGQDRREDYLLLKVFQLAIRDEVMEANSLRDIIEGHPMYASIAVQYFRPKQRTYARDSFQAFIRDLVDAEDLDLETDAVQIYQRQLKIDQMRGDPRGNRPRDVTYNQALADPETRKTYADHLHLLQVWTAAFINQMVASTKKMPYSIRYLARERLEIAREKFPHEPELHAAYVGRLVFYRYINPALVAPETFDIVSHTIDVVSRTNLAQISTLLTQIISGREISQDQLDLWPIHGFVSQQIPIMNTWMLDVANVSDAETQFHAHEFVDATVQPKPIYISPNEIYTVHGLLSQHQNTLAPAGDDPLRVILIELDGVPQSGSDELNEAREQAITLELTNRFADVQAKRGVLAVLRVQPAQDLIQSFLLPVTDRDEEIWEEILDAEIMNEGARHGRQASQAVPDPAYRLDDIRSLNFKAVKAKALSYLLELEKQGKISRSDNFQGILNAIAGDVRSKHRKRIQRQQEMQNMHEALRQLAERKAHFEDQLQKYNDYVKTAMETMQKGKGKQRFTLPWKPQFFHMLELQRSSTGPPKFGSFKYTAKELYNRKILLSIDQYSPRQFDKVWLIMSSDTPGVFELELKTNVIGVSTVLGHDEVRIEKLLDDKYNQVSSLSLFDGQVKVNFENFLYQINKKFYVS
ncbi:hypothetical protein BDZ89DRAFT_1087964 [Hymenopellis radicata]|nr:hypothetical protein BDZ89DRAFT_1087964 [Hymenopellis radicata]